MNPPPNRRTGGAPQRKRSSASGQGSRRAGTQAKPSAPARDVHDPNGIRLQKVMASAGVGSRRACEDMIANGHVTVDGQVVRELGVRVRPDAVIEVLGERIVTDPQLITLAFNKPAGVVSAMSDPQGRECLADYVRDRPERLFHVGRLDQDSEGLILLTNDGELANRLSHPSFEVPKTYLATVEGQVPPRIGKQLRAGIELDDGPVFVDSFRVVDSVPGYSQVEIVLHSGRNRVVRRIMSAVGHPVTELARVRIGPIRLGELKQGRYRVLSPAELGSLLKLADR